MSERSLSDLQTDVIERTAKASSTASEGIACNACRKAKLRCSRDRPHCAYCRKTGFDCTYESKRTKPGIKAGAIEIVHRRLDELERRIDEQAINNARRDHSSRDASIHGTSDSGANKILALLAEELPKLVNSSQSQVTSTPEHSQRSTKRRRTGGADASDASDHIPSLPESRDLEAVVTNYFFHIHPWIPMIHQARFIQRLEDPSQRTQIMVIIQAMMLAACKYVPNAWSHAQTPPEIRRWVICTAMDSMSIEGQQALVILAFNDIGSGNATKAWSIIGSLTRTVEYLQLAQEQGDGRRRLFSRPYPTLSPTDNWTEVEERRRVFWNVFLLDRFCSVTMGWNTSLTSDDVFRRLPCDGHLWRKEKPVLTPYLGIWDKAKGRLGNPISSVSRYPSPTQMTTRNGEDHVQMMDNNHLITTVPDPETDMSNVGAFAYNIEATESMSRVTSYFLQQNINVRDNHEIGAWLTRFKELDLRLVHWKLLLPQKWKANPNLTRHVPLMDPNLTTAHVTHNASMILLHQPIAYPPLHWAFRKRLPSTCSAEACYLAGIEIATITEKYLGKSPLGSPIGIQFAFCLFIAARVLLIHSRYTPGILLPPEFWSLHQSLKEMSRRWRGLETLPASPVSINESRRQHQLSSTEDLFAKYATRLKNLYDLCQDETYQLDVVDYTNEINHSSGEADFGTNSWSNMAHDTTLQDYHVSQALVSDLDTSDYATIPLLDQTFMDMDRVIAFDDGSMFTVDLDPNNTTW
ncbi:hypothetical protein T440DRAFT_450619 [Plenodomus tracheiphilus IPT5]|uniref:Zn(2)-C6 fungal-type domain-containing protein n=1 Tax=Plenodomus tracheiphilus IPT5 TaxID=1408161 RepID=A0A6A7B5R6_9PLEO|nr:hypothetical protein T440DRAFT_450619 [Plenodomus tracheiphilus IPT5]